MTMLDAALAYIAEGFKIMPVRPDKTPLTEHGLKDCTQIQARVKEFWTRWPDAGIAMLTDGLVVVDFDKKNGGYESKKAIEAKYGPMLKTRTHRTGGGGLHYIYRNPNGSNIRNTTALGGYQGVDIRANGGYIVAPPSPHLSGKCYEIVDNSPIVPAPSWLMALTKLRNTPLTRIDSIEGEPILEGQRDSTLTSLAGAMRRRGMTAEEILAALQVANKRCQPGPLPDADIQRIAKSVARYDPAVKTTESLESLESLEVLENLENLEKFRNLENLRNDKVPAQTYKKLSLDIKKWLILHKGETFDLDIICRQMGITDPAIRNLVTIKLSYEVKHENLEKNNRLYIYNDSEYKIIDWQNAPDQATFDVKWPHAVDPDDESTFSLFDKVTISPGDIIVLAGVSNMGKTAFCLNFLWENMDSHPCTLMGNEYTAGKFKRRVARMNWQNPLNDDHTPKFELIERRDNWKSIIRPNNINIIDWINLGENFYQMGMIIEGIQSKLHDGIALLSIQKDENKTLGLGGGFSQHLASLYLTVDFERLTIVKAKEWHGVNPNGKMYGFKIDEGVRFHHIRQVKLCHKCNGSGKTNKGTCDICDGIGSSDVYE